MDVVIYFCEGTGRPVIEVKESETRIKNIPYTIVIHKHIDVADTRFATIPGTLVKIIWKIFSV